MNARASKQLVAGGALGAVLIGTMAMASSATADVADDQNVEVSVDIEAVNEPGVLAMTVAAESTTLTEVDSDDVDTRTFTGSLPQVTVTDTRTAEEVPEGAFWAVVGSASDFTGDNGTIGAEYLGWVPNLIEGDDDGNVMVGEEVVSVEEEETQPGNNVGLVDQELLVSTFDSASTAGDAYTVDADLNLVTPGDVEAGSYTSTLTLSLFE